MFLYKGKKPDGIQDREDDGVFSSTFTLSHEDEKLFNDVKN